MFRLTAPSESTMAQAVSDASREPLPELATTPDATGKVPGYHVEHIEHRLGSGSEAYAAACESLRHWKHYDQPWIRVRPQPPALKIGTTFAVAAWTYGLWTLNTCRVFEVMGDVGALRRCGFAYRTLPAHVERGDARFWIEQRPADESVWLCIHTISRLHHPLTRLFAPLGRRAQAAALRGAIASIHTAVNQAPVVSRGPTLSASSVR